MAEWQNTTGGTAPSVVLEPPGVAATAQSSLTRQSEGPSRQLAPYLSTLIARRGATYEPRPMTRPVVESLSPRERNVLELIGDGKSNEEIARILRIAPETVKSHVRNMFVKLGVDRRAQAVARAQSLGLFAMHGCA